jgi:DNA invertase Pin-like site-specific DNA recombinase
MRIFYERVSTEHQSLARQEELLKQLDIEKVYADKATGKHIDRPQLKAMLEFAREGDTIVVESFSRLSRSTKDLLHLVEVMRAKGIAFESQKEKIDTSTASGKLFLTIVAALNEFEREVLLERQAEGIAIAKRNGKYTGRVHATIDRYLFVELYKDYKRKHITQKYMCKRLGISRSTLYKEIKKYEMRNIND